MITDLSISINAHAGKSFVRSAPAENTMYDEDETNILYDDDETNFLTDEGIIL